MKNSQIVLWLFIPAISKLNCENDDDEHNDIDIEFVIDNEDLK